MFKPNTQIQCIKTHQNPPKDNLVMLCWNVAKLTNKETFTTYLDSIIKEKNVDILLFQEFKKSVTKELQMGGFSYILAPNMQTKKNIFGVLSAFKIDCNTMLTLLSKKRELHYLTHKSALITRHTLDDSHQLLIANIHAVNFVKNRDFFDEMNQIKEAIYTHQGPMIIAGDFNTWNKKRMQFLKMMIQELSLKEILPQDNHFRKKFFKHPLDHVFYRGFDVMMAQVLNSRKISDHNPLLVTFKNTIC
ncbi:endonuclease/exonuclease/phosphatase family protein [Sulfurospirillum sp. 1612]|uniref:endonuclease/exonuclease/phosphatase family protein n=1 Tax=Sulfurospirillum sp. 1612 TaxID=3094835 RepID=UPI002F93CA53